MLFKRNTYFCASYCFFYNYTALSLAEINDNCTLDQFTHFLDKFIDSGLAVYSSETLILQTEQSDVNMFKNLNL